MTEPYFVEGGDDLVEYLEADDSSLVDLCGGEEVHEVGDGGEHDRHVAVGLGVQLASLALVGKVHGG